MVRPCTGRASRVSASHLGSGCGGAPATKQAHPPIQSQGAPMGLRDRRDKRRDERDTFGRSGNAQRYQMRQKLVSVGDDY